MPWTPCSHPTVRDDACVGNDHEEDPRSPPVRDLNPRGTVGAPGGPAGTRFLGQTRTPRPHSRDGRFSQALLGHSQGQGSRPTFSFYK